MNVGIVLSGGGARCFSHIGGLKALEEHDIQVSSIAGSSSGAVTGALYASGLDADTLHLIVKTLKLSKRSITVISGTRV
jgi:NTE family protein